MQNILIPILIERQTGKLSQIFGMVKSIHLLWKEAIIPQGHLILTRSLDEKQFSHQDIGTGPFSLMYIKIALENPDWNGRGKTDGTANVTIQNISVNIQPPKGLSEGVTIPTVSMSDIDYAWFTPGGGGAPSYTPFPNSSPPPSFHTPTSVQDLENELGQWEKQDPTAKTFAADVLSLVQKYSSGGSPLVPIESWIFTVITNISDNDFLSTAYSSLTPSQKADFNTLSGYSDFKAKASSHSYDALTVTAIAECFSGGTFGLHNPNILLSKPTRWTRSKNSRSKCLSKSSI